MQFSALLSLPNSGYPASLPQHMRKPMPGGGGRLRACVRAPATSRGVAARLGSGFRHGCRPQRGSPAAVCGVPGRETQRLADLPARLRCIAVRRSPAARAAAGGALSPVPRAPQSSPVLQAACAGAGSEAATSREGVLFLCGSTVVISLPSLVAWTPPATARSSGQSLPHPKFRLATCEPQAHGSAAVFRVDPGSQAFVRLSSVRVSLGLHCEWIIFTACVLPAWHHQGSRALPTCPCPSSLIPPFALCH